MREAIWEKSWFAPFAPKNYSIHVNSRLENDSGGKLYILSVENEWKVGKIYGNSSMFSDMMKFLSKMFSVPQNNGYFSNRKVNKKLWITEIYFIYFNNFKINFTLFVNGIENIKIKMNINIKKCKKLLILSNFYT